MSNDRKFGIYVPAKCKYVGPDGTLTPWMRLAEPFESMDAARERMAHLGYFDDTSARLGAAYVCQVQP